MVKQKFIQVRGRQFKHEALIIRNKCLHGMVLLWNEHTSCSLLMNHGNAWRWVLAIKLIMNLAHWTFSSSVTYVLRVIKKFTSIYKKLLPRSYIIRLMVNKLCMFFQTHPHKIQQLWCLQCHRRRHHRRRRRRRHHHHHHHHHLSRIRPLACSGSECISWTYESIWIVGRTLWMGDQPDMRPPPTHRTTKHRKNMDTHPCLEWDLNPWSQCLCGWRQNVPQTAWPLGPALTM